MRPSVTLAVSRRVAQQLAHDRRTLALLLVAPCAVMALVSWMFSQTDADFDQLGSALLALFPFIVMFLVTSVTTLRERTSGTLERLLAMPVSKFDLLGGYAATFGAVAALQSALAVTLSVAVLDLNVQGSPLALALVAVVVAELGTALGLFVSAFARTEFQAVQLLPAIVMPQVLLCGLFLPRDDLPPFLQSVSSALPLTFAVDAMRAVTAGTDMSEIATDLAAMALFAGCALAVGAATLRRSTR